MLTDLRACEPTTVQRERVCVWVEGGRGGKRDREGRGTEKGPRKSAPKRAVAMLRTAQVHQSHSIDDKLCYRLDDLSQSERSAEREGEDGEEWRRLKEKEEGGREKREWKWVSE